MPYRLSRALAIPLGYENYWWLKGPLHKKLPGFSPILGGPQL